MNNWYVVTGGPSTGKTTLLAELEKRGYKTMPEGARVYIDEHLAKGETIEQIRADEEGFQQAVLRLKATVESQLEADQTIFLDRGMQDSIAYLRAYDYKIEDWMASLMERANYRKVFLLEPLPRFVKDYARTEDKDFTKRLNQLLFEAYAECGMTALTVPALSPAERADFVLNNL